MATIALAGAVEDETIGGRRGGEGIKEGYEVAEAGVVWKGD